MKAGWMVLPALLLGAGTAHAAEIYCNSQGGTFPEGTNLTREWYVTAATARKPQLGQAKATTSCSINFSTLSGMHKPIEIVAKPTLGQATTTLTKIFYKPAKTGEDSITVRFQYIGRTGRLQTSMGTYRIHVVDRPL
jgi:hypothetical protein